MTLPSLLLFLVIAQQPAVGDGEIRGQLRDRNGAPASGVRVALTPVADDLGADTLSALTETDFEGRYRLESVPPGRYLIMAGRLAFPSYFPGVALRDQAKTVTVAAGQSLTGLDFIITPESQAPTPQPQLTQLGCTPSTGTVALDDGGALPRQVPMQFVINGRQVAAEESATCTALHLRPLAQLRNGQVRAGVNEVRAIQLPPGFYVKSVTLGTIDLTQPADIPAALVRQPLKIVLTRTRPAGMPPGVNVSGGISYVAFPVSTEIRLVMTGTSPAGDRIGPTEISSNRMTGFFLIPGVAPGHYSIEISKDYIADLVRNGAPLLDVDFGVKTFDVDGNDVVSLNLDVRSKRFKDRTSVNLNPQPLLTVSGKIESAAVVPPEFQLDFTANYGSQETHTAKIVGQEFSVQLPDGEYHVTASGLPQGYTATVVAGPLALSEWLLVTKAAIADPVTRTPVRGAVAVRVTVPPAER